MFDCDLNYHTSKHTCNYLDLSLKIVDSHIETNLYNETDSLDFKVNRFPHMDSEVSIRVKRNVVYTEILRMANACPKVEYFCEKWKDFFIKFL